MSNFVGNMSSKRIRAASVVLDETTLWITGGISENGEATNTSDFINSTLDIFPGKEIVFCYLNLSNLV